MDDHRCTLKAVEAQELSLATLLAAITENPGVNYFPEHTHVVRLDIIRTNSDKFLGPV